MIQRLRAASSAVICIGDSGSPSILSGTSLVLGIRCRGGALDGSNARADPGSSE